MDDKANQLESCLSELERAELKAAREARQKMDLERSLRRFKSPAAITTTAGGGGGGGGGGGIPVGGSGGSGFKYSTSRTTPGAAINEVRRERDINKLVVQHEVRGAQAVDAFSRTAHSLSQRKTQQQQTQPAAMHRSSSGGVDSHDGNDSNMLATSAVQLQVPLDGDRSVRDNAALLMRSSHFGTPLQSLDDDLTTPRTRHNSDDRNGGGKGTTTDTSVRGPTLSYDDLQTPLLAVDNTVGSQRSNVAAGAYMQQQQPPNYGASPSVDLLRHRHYRSEPPHHTAVSVAKHHNGQRVRGDDGDNSSSSSSSDDYRGRGRLENTAAALRPLTASALKSGSSVAGARNDASSISWQQAERGNVGGNEASLAPSTKVELSMKARGWNVGARK